MFIVVISTWDDHMIMHYMRSNVITDAILDAHHTSWTKTHPVYNQEELISIICLESSRKSMPTIKNVHHNECCMKCYVFKICSSFSK